MRGSVDMALVPPFVEVVRQGSFTRAAAVLEMPKSTVSRRVSKLEQALGVPLLVRTTRKLRLTEEGERFYERVSKAVEQVEEAARSLVAQREEPRGTLRITAPTDWNLLPEIVASFLARYPEVRVEVNTSGEFLDLVAEGYDLAIRAGRLRDSTLIARRLAIVDFQLFASRSYLAEHGEPSTLAELREHECVLFRPKQGVSRWSLTSREGTETVEVSGRLAVDDLPLVRGAVRAGVGIGLLPSSMFELEGTHVQRVLPEYNMAGGAVHIVYPGTRHVPAKVRAFRDHLLERKEW